MSKNRPKIPVEPLSEARWAKVDDALFAALDAGASTDAVSTPSRPKRTVVVGATVLALAAGVLLFLFFRRGTPVPTDVVLNPSHIETGETPSRLALGESTIEVAPSSAIVASGDDAHGILVVVEKGKVDCEVTPRSARPPFVVQAGNVRVRVVGTRFAVVRDAGSVRVTVAHGAVEVSRGSEVVMLHDGESWPPAQSPPPAQSAAPAPTAALPPSGSSVPAPTEVAPRLPRDMKPAPSAAPSFDAQKTYEAAARSEASDPDGAMATYRRLAATGGPWAPTALFAAGRLSEDRGRHAEAKRLLEEYLTRFPRGANAEDARRILDR